jgi:hypothetical protein
MDKWLAKFLGNTLEKRTDIPDTLADLGRMSALSVPFLSDQPKISDALAHVPPVPPLEAGWFVTYTDRQGHLCGGWDDRQKATVTHCLWSERGWSVHLSDGQTIPLPAVRCVGQTNEQGELKAAWSVREHGYDGQ